MLRRHSATVLSAVSIRSLLSTRFFCAPSTSADGDQIPTVRTTGIRWTQNDVNYTCNGVYWGREDPRNKSAQKKNDSTDLQGAMLRSIVMALEQAKKDGLKRIRVQTDFKFLKEPDYRKAILKFKARDFTTRFGKLMPNSELYERILEFMDEMEVTLEHRFPFLENRQGNAVLTLLKEDKERQYPKPLRPLLPVDSHSPDYEYDWTITPNVPPLDGRPIPTVYVAGRLEVSPYNGFAKGACASLWVPESIEHLDIKRRPLGSIQRLSMYPTTHFRTQLAAIHDAITEARNLEIPEIRVVTDSLHFMHFFTRDWKKLDGSPVANEKKYRKIKALTETVKVHFKGVRCTEESEDSLLMKVQEMANDGLGFPKATRDTKEYEMSMDELLSGKDAVYSVEGTSTRRVRIFKASSGFASGVMWDRMDVVPLEAEEAKSADGCLNGVKRKTPAAMLHAVLEHADRMGFECLVIRTNQPILVRSTLAFLEIWHRYDWMDVRWRQLREQELWKRIWEITQRIEIIWDLIENVDEVKDETYLIKYRKEVKGRKKREEKLGRPKKKSKGLPPIVN